ASELKPARLSRVRRMKEAVGFFLDQRHDEASKIGCRSRRAHLVVHHAQLSALAAEPQHGFDEVPLGALGSSKQAAGPHDEMPAADRSHEMLASELADSVG